MLIVSGAELTCRQGPCPQSHVLFRKKDERQLSEELVTHSFIVSVVASIFSQRRHLSSSLGTISFLVKKVL